MLQIEICLLKRVHVNINLFKPCCATNFTVLRCSFTNVIICMTDMTAEERLAKQRSQGAIPKRRPVKQEESESPNEEGNFIRPFYN